MLKLKGYGEPQAKANEKRQRFKGWETLVIYNINSSKRELCIFIPDVKVVLIYRDNKKRIILINSNKFKIDGITYVSSDNIWVEQFN